MWFGPVLENTSRAMQRRKRKLSTDDGSRRVKVERELRKARQMDACLEIGLDHLSSVAAAAAAVDSFPEDVVSSSESDDCELPFAKCELPDDAYSQCVPQPKPIAAHLAAGSVSSQACALIRRRNLCQSMASVSQSSSGRSVLQPVKDENSDYSPVTSDRYM